MADRWIRLIGNSADFRARMAIKGAVTPFMAAIIIVVLGLWIFFTFSYRRDESMIPPSARDRKAIEDVLRQMK
jgi:heme/copper-type cytochrome/quinol oxidase subunit 2